MRIRTYQESELDYFPIYASTSNVNFVQASINRPDGYNIHQVFMVNNGCGVLKIDNTEFYLEENDLFYISSETPHAYYPIDDNFSTSYLSFFGEGFDKIKEYYSIADYGVYPKKAKGDFLNSLQNLYEKMDGAHETSTLCALTFTAVICFFEEAFKKQTTNIENVNNYLESNFQKNISLDDILGFYPYSKAKLCRDFKKTYNTTIFDKLLSVRLRHAHEMLISNNNLKLKDIAPACGFNDISYFCKMYKKMYSVSPKIKKDGR